MNINNPEVRWLIANVLYRDYYVNNLVFDKQLQENINGLPVDLFAKIHDFYLLHCIIIHQLISI